MRIAILSDDYLPESTLVHAKMLHELALQLKMKGHKPIVITPSFKRSKKLLLVDDVDGIEVWRFKSGKTRGVGKIKRALNESLLSFNAWLAIGKLVRATPFDLCINYSPTIFFGPLVSRFKKANQATKSYLVLRDLFPQWVIDEGMISEGSLIARYFRLFESLNYAKSDVIGLMSEANQKYFTELNPEHGPLEVLRNWSQVEQVILNPESLDLRSQYGLEDKVIFFYGGNIGHAQDMANIMRLAKSLLKVSNAHFLLVGQGDEFGLVQHLREQWCLSNVTILSSVDQETYKQFLKQVDVGLFSLARSHKAHNFPGKLLGYMLESLPILGSVNPGNDLVEFVSGKDAGFAFINGEDDKLADAATQLAQRAELRESMGKNANVVLKQYFSVESAANQILTSIEQLS